ncbi:MAG: GIVxVP protein [Synechococcus sp.]|nr:GIVxVP protein [Synechococcus sp.]
MARNNVAAGMVMVPCVLLGGAFLSTAIWTDAAGPNRSLALAIGAMLLVAGVLAYGLAVSRAGSDPAQNDVDSAP